MQTKNYIYKVLFSELLNLAEYVFAILSQNPSIIKMLQLFYNKGSFKMIFTKFNLKKST